jgi:tRNA threonylcarbamoyladenosine biosynthesis protein TsaB
MILFIDTSDFNGLRFGLVDSQGKAAPRESVRPIAYNENFKTAELLQKFLDKNKIQPSELGKIVVCSGPGSFTGIRVGVALAEALGFALNIPVIAVKKSQVPPDLDQLRYLRGGKNILLNYGQKPNITKPKLK